MLKKTIKFKDLDGKELEEDFYFNLTKAEIAELELSTQGGLGEHLEKIIESEDGGEIIRIFKQILTMAYGVRSEDGRRFIKSEELSLEFSQTDAFSELFMMLVTDAPQAAEFIKGIVPPDLQDILETGERVTTLPLPDDEQPAWIKENREPTTKELATMSPKQLRDAFMRKNVAPTE